MRIRAFRGIRYAEGQGPDQDPGRLVAPPYDQISDARRDELQALDPHHFAHLIRPVPASETEDAYQHAASLHAEWRSEGVIVEEETPSVYPYAIQLAGGGHRLGLLALVDLEPPESGVIRPHEQTIDKPLADRLALLRATRADLEPALLLSEDEGWLEAMLVDDVVGRAPLCIHVDESGHRHALYRIDDPDRIAEYREILLERPAAIADGHHRYKTGLLYQAEVGALPGSPAAAKLAVITSLSSKSLRIEPIHRALREAPDLDALAAAVGAERRIVPAGPDLATAGRAFAKAVAAAEQPALGVWRRGAEPEVWLLDPSTAPAAVAPNARGLPVVLLQEVVYPALGLPRGAASDGTVLYRSDADELARMVQASEVGLGLFLPPMTPMAFSVAIAQGNLLPPKSTRFLPKVYSGLVWASHDSELD